MMVPQVLASIHTLFPDAAERGRSRSSASPSASARGWLHRRRLARGVEPRRRYGLRSIFGVNVPIGIAIVIAASLVMPAMPRSANTRLDLPGTTVLLAGLLGLIVPLMLGREFGGRGGSG